MKRLDKQFANNLYINFDRLLMINFTEIIVYLIGISFITYIYEINKPCTSDWHFVILIILAILGVSFIAKYLGNIISKSE